MHIEAYKPVEFAENKQTNLKNWFLLFLLSNVILSLEATDEYFLLVTAF